METHQFISRRKEKMLTLLAEQIIQRMKYDHEKGNGIYLNPIELSQLIEQIDQLENSNKMFLDGIEECDMILHMGNTIRERDTHNILHALIDVTYKKEKKE